MKGKANCTAAARAMDVSGRETSEVEIVLRSQKANLILARDRESERERLSRIGEANHSFCRV